MYRACRHLRTEAEVLLANSGSNVDMSTHRQLPNRAPSAISQEPFDPSSSLMNRYKI